jgi:Flp pilus assembly protein TadB
VTRLGIEVRTTRMLMLVILAAIVIEVAVLIVSPLFFSLNLLIVCVGVLTRRVRRRTQKSVPETVDADP